MKEPTPLTAELERFQDVGLHGFDCSNCTPKHPPRPRVVAEWRALGVDVGRLELTVTCQHCGRGFTLTGRPRLLA